LIAVLGFAVMIVLINRRAYRCIEDLGIEELENV